MNRSTFFKTLFGGAVAAPAIIKVAAEEPKVLESKPEVPKPAEPIDWSKIACSGTINYSGTWYYPHGR